MDVIVDYRLTGSGWARCSLDIYGQTCTMTASYLSDALEEFVNGMNRVLAGRKEANFSFLEEPGENVWCLQSLEVGTLSVRILSFPEDRDGKADSEGKVLIQATCPTRDFAQALLTSLNALLKEHGLEGYEELWRNHEFPLEAYHTLCSYLGAAPITSDRYIGPKT